MIVGFRRSSSWSSIGTHPRAPNAVELHRPRSGPESALTRSDHSNPRIRSARISRGLGPYRVSYTPSTTSPTL